MTNFIDIIYETINFYYDIRIENLEKSSEIFLKYTSKLNKIAPNFVIAKATLVPSKFNILEQNELKNSYFGKITEDFILVNNAEIGEIKELANFVTPFKNGNIFMPKNWESFFSKVENDNAEKFEYEKIQKSQKIHFLFIFIK